MISAHDMNWHPDAVRHDTSNPDHHAANQHRLMDGKVYAPADNLKLGYEGAHVDHCIGAGLLFMSFGDVGLSLAMPPPSLRALAAQLVRIADMADAAATKAAGEALDAATSALHRGSGK